MIRIRWVILSSLFTDAVNWYIWFCTVTETRIHLLLG